MTRRTLRALARTLPFHLDDAEHVNALFRRWHHNGAARDKRLVDIWTYCYVYRYFLMKLGTADRDASLSIDQLVALAFVHVQRRLDTVRQPGRYTAWVCTICKHVFVNYLRDRRPAVSLDEAHPALVTEEAAPVRSRDAGVVYATLCAAIDALPDYLRDVTRMRLLDNRPYAAISRETGKPPSSLRVYVNKALRHLRRHPGLRALRDELRDG